MGYVLYQTGQFTEAATWLRRATASGDGLPSRPDGLDTLGDALWRSGQNDEAVQIWRKALDECEKLPSSPGGHHNIATNLSRKLDAAEHGRAPAVSSIPSERAATTQSSPAATQAN